MIAFIYIYVYTVHILRVMFSVEYYNFCKLFISLIVVNLTHHLQKYRFYYLTEEETKALLL